MKKYLILLAVLLISVTAALIYFTYQTTDNSIPSAEADLARRENIYKQWLAAIEQNSAVMQNQEAREVLTFLKTNGKIARPHQNDLEVLLQHDEKIPSLRIVMLLPEDRSAGPRWQKIFGILGSQFVPSLNALVIKVEPDLSNTEKIFTLLHEGRHALDFSQGKFPVRGQKEDACFEELRAWIFQIRLMELVGGPEYQKLLQSKMEQIMKYDDPRRVLAPNGPYEPRLDDIFGKANSDEEKTLRQSAFYINALFRIMDTQYHDQAEQLKMNVICTLYSSWVYDKL